MTELFGLDLFGLGLGLFGSVFGLRLIMPRLTHHDPAAWQPDWPRTRCLEASRPARGSGCQCHASGARVLRREDFEARAWPPGRATLSGLRIWGDCNPWHLVNRIGISITDTVTQYT
jgi:hypothetical protein